MSFPRINSLSTVGILKHYIQDYWLHHIRTDFVGANGAGKSIIADLLQLLFVYESDLISFGTDGVDDKRTVQSIPYRCTVGYCFINVEVSKDRFVILGTAISSNSGSRIKPFVILKTAYLDANFESNLLHRNDLVLAADFVSGDQILDLPQLSLHLRNRGLHLRDFKRREDVNNYYGFLYKNQILPINLTQLENLKAFAKVIQSFSKAKALNLKSSATIKSFLFDEAEADFTGEFEQNETRLNELLRQYDRFSKFTDDLEQKQSVLKALKEQETTRDDSRKRHRRSEVIYMHQQFREKSQLAGEYERALQTNNESLAMLNKRLEELPELVESARQSLDEVMNSFSKLADVEQLLGRIEGLTNQLVALKLANTLVLPDAYQAMSVHPVQPNGITAELVKKQITLIHPLVLRYNDWHVVTEKWTEQKAWIRSELFGKEAAIKSLTDLLKTLDQAEPTNLLGWALTNIERNALTKDAENIVMHLAGERISKPDPAEEQLYIHQPGDLLNLIAVERDDEHEGLWIELGPLRRFVADYKGQSLFKNGSFAAAKEQFTTKLNGEKTALEDEVRFLQRLDEGRVEEARELDYPIDYDLAKAGSLEAISTAIKDVLRTEAAIQHLEDGIKAEQTSLKVLREASPLCFEYNSADEIRYCLQDARKNRKATVDKLNDELLGKTKAKSAAESTVARLKQEAFDLSSEASALSLNSQDLLRAYYQDYGETLSADDFEEATDDLTTLHQAAIRNDEQYADGYRNAASRFEETRTDKNPGILIEIDEKRFGFASLERAMLGERIVHSSEIVPALNEANLKRRNIAGDIRDSMTKVFRKTVDQYNRYEDKIKQINAFFRGQKISNQFYFRVGFARHATHSIDLLTRLSVNLTNAHKVDELPMGQSIGDVIADVYRRLANSPDKLPVKALLNPKTFFELSVGLEDADGVEIPGSSGETYSAIALLGIARLSLMDKETRRGLRFIILEEVGTLDSSNFETFPAVAREYDYQIITMAPAPFNANISSEWHAYHLIKSEVKGGYNCKPMAYFHTPELSQELAAYLKSQSQ